VASVRRLLRACISPAIECTESAFATLRREASSTDYSSVGITDVKAKGFTRTRRLEGRRECLSKGPD
jgi:hypothetical protein